MNTEPSIIDSHSIKMFEELCLSRARPVITAELRSFDGGNLAVVEKELAELDTRRAVRHRLPIDDLVVVLAVCVLLL